MENITIDYEFTTNPVVLYVRDRIFNKHMDLLAACVGERGVGKSWSMVAFALTLDSTFNIDRVIFSYNDLIDVAEKREHPPGTVFIFDEVTADALQARNFMSKSNKNLSALLQTFRSLRYIVLLTTPNLTFIDKQARLLLHMVFVVTDKISPELKDSYRKIMPFFVHSPPIWAADGKPTYKFATWGIDNNAVQIAAFMIPKPPEEFIKLYEIKKREFQQKLYSKLRNDYDDGFSNKPKPKSTFGQYQYIDLNAEENKE